LPVVVVGQQPKPKRVAESTSPPPVKKEPAGIPAAAEKSSESRGSVGRPKTPSDGSGAFKRASRPELLRPGLVKEASDKPGPVRGISAWEVALIGLVGSTEVPAVLIPLGNGRITRTEFDLDRLRKYKAVGYDENRVFLTEKHADLDHGKNSLATDWVQNYSDAAKDPDGHLPSPEKLYGPVYVVARDPVMKSITKSMKQLKKLKHALEWKYPLRRTD
jgi:hypothetical protein